MELFGMITVATEKKKYFEIIAVLVALSHIW